MNRILMLIPATLLALAACTASPGSTPLSVPSGLPTIPPASDLASLGGQGLALVCTETGDASLIGLADRLRNVDANADQGGVVDAIAVVIANLQQADVSDTAAAARDEAVDQLRQAQSALSDPATGGDAATSAADALESLESEICA